MKSLKSLRKTFLNVFTFSLPALLPFCLALLVSCSQRSPEIYSSAKPLTRWWWFASEIQKPDIAFQLDWLKANGFGGVEVAWIYPLNRMKKDTVNYTPRQEWLSPEWTDVVKYCKQYGDSIGLSVDFTFGSLWPFGDQQVDSGESSKIFGDPGYREWINVAWYYPKKGLVIDHLDKTAFVHYAGRMGKALEPAMNTGRPSGIFVDSWEVDTHNIWTTGFDSIFKSRFGYDIVPYMKSGILNKGNEGQRYDYMKLVSSLVLDNFYVPFTEEAHRLGGFSRGQCAGSPTDLISAYAAMDVPETEAMLYEPSYSRIVASAAALSGKKRVTSETFTCLYGFPREHMRQEKVTDLKMVADALFAHGVNQIIWHGTPYNTIGSDTVSFYATTHVGKAGALSEHLSSFNAYMSVVSEYMRKGVTYSDAAVYLPLEDAWIAGAMPKEKQLPWAWGEYEFRYRVVPEEVRGYQPLWVNGRFLKEGTRHEAQGASKAQEKTEKGNSKTVETHENASHENAAHENASHENASHENASLQIGGCEFRSLYADVKYLDYEVLKTMVGLAEGGLPVCLLQKPEEAGFVKHPDFEKLAARLRELSSTEWSGLSAAKPLVEGDNLPYFWCRRDNDQYYIFFAHPVASSFNYPVKYGQADTAVDEIRNIRINIGGKSTAVQLTFHPYESLMLQIGTNGKYQFIPLPAIK